VTTPRDAKPKVMPASIGTTDRATNRTAGGAPHGSTNKSTNKTTNETTNETTNGLPADRRLAWLDRMRPFRARHERDVSMEAALQSLERQLREQHNAVGDIIDVWNEIVPAPLQGIATIGGVSQGTLTLVCATSGASYEISRALRDGLERTLMQRLPSRVKRIKVRVA